MKDFLYILKEYINTKDDCIYLVGGTVRDIKAGRNISDYDFAVCKNFDNAANYFASKVKGSYVKMHEDTSRVVKDGVIFDFSKLKGNTIHEDLRKRDFTIDSMAIDLRDKSFIDDTGGLNDLMNKKIRVTYDEAFKDDGARILRAFRLYAVLGFEIDLNTLKLIKINAPMLSLIPGERMLSEIIKIFESKRAYDTLSLMDKEGVLKIIFPQVEPLKKVGKCKYHVVDAFTHSMLVLKFAEEGMKYIYNSKWGEEIKSHFEEKINGEKRIAIFKMGCFFHDIGKPKAYKNENGKVSFKLHEVYGKDVFSEISTRLSMPNHMTKIIKSIIGGHMRVLGFYKQNSSESAYYRFFKDYKENSIDVVLCSLFDITATRSLLDDNGERKKYFEFILEIIDKYYSKFARDSIIDGRDVIEYTGAKDKKVGEILDKVEEMYFCGKIKNKGEAIEFLKRYK